MTTDCFEQVAELLEADPENEEYREMVSGLDEVGTSPRKQTHTL